MVRPTTIKFATMSVGNLVQLRAEVDRHLEQRRKDLEEQLTLIGGHTKFSSGVDGPSHTKRIKVKPKYRGPKGETWAGRGLRPVWLAALIKQGHRVDEYAIGRRQAAVSKRVDTKRSGRGRRARPR